MVFKLQNLWFSFLITSGILLLKGEVNLITKFQYKILKKTLKNCGFNPKNQREIDACKYLFDKKCIQRSRNGKYTYSITQEGEVAIKAYFQDISRFWLTTTLSIIALITGIFSISIQTEPLTQLLEILLK